MRTKDSAKFLGKMLLYLIILAVALEIGGSLLVGHMSNSMQKDLEKQNDKAFDKAVCQERKNYLCDEGISPNKSSYSERCFRNGENILETPYRCPG